MLLSAQRLCKSFTLGEETLSVIEDMSLSVDHGEFVAIMGTSGSGKSTLMHIFGVLSQPDSG
ncbi:MAG: ATP-binding cassette domain-containing protein, partial [Desulfofustis sp.]|nr:ATP-binding cassette domain-containing protein [Desulfofustis sp.]